MRRDVALWLLVILCAGLAGALIVLVLRGSQATLSEPIEVPPPARAGPERGADGGDRPRTERRRRDGARPAARPQPAPAPAPAPSPPPPVDDDDGDDDPDDVEIDDDDD